MKESLAVSRIISVETDELTNNSLEVSEIKSLRNNDLTNLVSLAVSNNVSPEIESSPIEPVDSLADTKDISEYKDSVPIDLSAMEESLAVANDTSLNSVTSDSLPAVEDKSLSDVCNICVSSGKDDPPALEELETYELSTAEDVLITKDSESLDCSFEKYDSVTNDSVAWKSLAVMKVDSLMAKEFSLA